MKDDPEEFKFAGIPTFMRAPYITLDEAAAYDVAVIGVPVDYGVSYREGARYGPRSIREHSHWDRLGGGQYYDFATATALNATPLRIADLGDVHIAPSDFSRTDMEIERVVRDVRRHTFPLILGGDHSITYSAFKGCVAALPQTQQPVGVLHFDAHPDVEEGYLTLARVWHGNPFRALIEEKRLSGTRMVTIGPRGLIPQRWVSFSRENNIKVYSTPECWRRGWDAILDDVVDQLQKECRSVYVSFDIDCIDPSQAPGTGTPSVGGPRAEEMAQVMRKLVRLPIVGFDLTELSPSLDPTGITSIVACDLLWNFLSFGYQKPGRDVKT